jgi:hypothetical protein
LYYNFGYAPFGKSAGRLNGSLRMGELVQAAKYGATVPTAVTYGTGF